MSLSNSLCSTRYGSRGFGKTMITIFQPVELEGDRAIPDHKLRLDDVAAPSLIINQRFSQPSQTEFLQLLPCFVVRFMDE
jgi:hypothetical protein